MATAACFQSVRWNAVAASARAHRKSAFHSVRILSSRPGRGRRWRASKSSRRGVLDQVRSREIAAVFEPVGDRAPLEVAAGRDAEPLEHGAHVLARPPVEGGADLGRRPRVEQALVTVPVLVGRVGVLRRVEPAIGMAQVAQDVLDRLLDDLAIAVDAEHGVRLAVDADQRRLVVQHLLEVGHQPLAVDRVAGEPAADVVVDAARRHRVERRGDDPAGVLRSARHVGAQHELEVEGRGELGGRPEPAPFRVEHAGQSLQRGVDRVATRHRVLGLGRGAAPGGGDERLGVLLEVVATVTPHVVETLDHAKELVTRKVRAAPEGSPVVVEGDRHRPATAAGQRLDGVHVDGVDVGSLLAVDLDVDEGLVHGCRHGVVLERLVRHHVAPVAGRVADAEQDRHIALACGGERLRPPRVPVDRIVAVLAQVRRRLLGQPVHGGTLPSPRRETSAAPKRQRRDSRRRRG